MGEVAGEIGDEHFWDGDALWGNDLAEEREGAGLSGAVGAQVAVGSDPPLFVSLFDLVGAGDGVGMRTSDEDGEALAVVITGMIFRDADGEIGDGDADVTLVEIVIGAGFGEGGERVIFVGEADPVTGGMPDVDVRSTAERAGGEGWGEISGIERVRNV